MGATAHYYLIKDPYALGDVDSKDVGWGVEVDVTTFVDEFRDGPANPKTRVTEATTRHRSVARPKEQYTEITREEYIAFVPNPAVETLRMRERRERNEQSLTKILRLHAGPE